METIFSVEEITNSLFSDNEDMVPLGQSTIPVTKIQNKKRPKKIKIKKIKRKKTHTKRKYDFNTFTSKSIVNRPNKPTRSIQTQPEEKENINSNMPEHNLKEELDEKKSIIQDLETKLFQLKDIAEELLAENQTLQNDCDEYYETCEYNDKSFQQLQNDNNELIEKNNSLIDQKDKAIYEYNLTVKKNKFLNEEIEKLDLKNCEQDLEIQMLREKQIKTEKLEQDIKDRNQLFLQNEELIQQVDLLKMEKMSVCEENLKLRKRLKANQEDKNQIIQLEEEKSNLNQVLIQKDQQIAQMNLEITHLANNLKTLEDYETVVNNLEIAELENLNKEEKIKDLNKLLVQKTDIEEQLRSEITQMENNLTELSRKFNSKLSKILPLNEEIKLTDLEEKNENLKLQLIKSTKMLNENEIEKSNFENKIKSNGKEINSFLKLQKQLNEKLVLLEKEYKNSKEKNAFLQKRNQEMDQTLAQNTITVGNLKTENEKLYKLLRDYQKKENLTNQSFEKQMKDQEKQLKELNEKSLQENSKKIQELQLAIEQMENDNAVFKKELENKQLIINDLQSSYKRATTIKKENNDKENTNEKDNFNVQNVKSKHITKEIKVKKIEIQIEPNQESSKNQTMPNSTQNNTNGIQDVVSTLESLLKNNALIETFMSLLDRIKRTSIKFINPKLPTLENNNSDFETIYKQIVNKSNQKLEDIQEDIDAFKTKMNLKSQNNFIVSLILEQIKFLKIINHLAYKSYQPVFEKLKIANEKFKNDQKLLQEEYVKQLKRKRKNKNKKKKKSKNKKTKKKK
ncbi:hypothetical protein M0813_16953 [Anaeramoeba flamelloides]|uniref:Uncharacterized protein n=1 Tax=Anaeramoeba flamelloides TaxID=1746091 RepID=A0ABQ8YY46_9EUKA|nr:hypothetical protein M0813_16953 [Anaeramoeba flamelloides]